MLEIPNMAEEELLFNFMDNLQSWAEQELRRRGVQDLATAMAVAESLVDYRRGDSSKPKPPSKGNQAKALNALKAKPMPKTPQSKGLMYVEALVNGKATKAWWTQCHSQLCLGDEARRLELQASKKGGWLKAVNSAAKPSHGVARGEWTSYKGQGRATTFPTLNGYPRGGEAVHGPYGHEGTLKTPMLSAMQVKKGLKREEVTYLATLRKKG
ncbi:hypothetical protein CK203_037991 [Vitis vinifera]|uniref:Uncharacterized protein n=1 Tax=Vitis vinifera TaxID=29760 RepID=A0A438HNS4_VITVI|nr:hypothetical protein CK203_037991 [Vitis vinifera]